MIESLASLAAPPDPTDQAGRTKRRLPVGVERDEREAIVTHQRTAELGALIDAWLAKPGRLPTLDVWTSTGADAIDPIEHLARRFGPYELSMTTFSVADSSLRRIRQLREAGFLTAVLIVADALMLSGPRANTAAAIRQTADRWAMVPTHAKAYVLWPADRDAPAWTINGSANLTSNPRCETIQVSDQRDLAAFYRLRTIEEIDRHELGSNQPTEATADDPGTTRIAGRTRAHRDRGRAVAGQDARPIPKAHRKRRRK